MLLAPLFIFIRADFGVSYTELGLALTAFNLVSAVLQTPVGFLVDRVGARSQPGRRAAARRRRRSDRRARRVLTGCSSPCSRCSAWPTPSTIRPTTRCCRERVAPARMTPGILVPHLLRHDRLGDGARHALVHAGPGGLARRVPLRGRNRRRDCADRSPAGPSAARSSCYARSEAARRRCRGPAVRRPSAF